MPSTSLRTRTAPDLGCRCAHSHSEHEAGVRCFFADPPGMGCECYEFKSVLGAAPRALAQPPLRQAA